MEQMKKDELIQELKQACNIASQYSGGYSNEFCDATEFYEALKLAIVEFENGDESKIVDFWVWFAPAMVWDDFIGADGLEFGNSIFEKIEIYKKDKNL